MKKFIFLAVLALAAMGALSLAGAGAAAKPASASSAPRAANSHPGTSGLVRQVGFRNYAGPNCPGKGWNCTTATRVLQIASPGGSNSFVCSPSNVSVPTPTPTNCVIKQVGGSTNTARCTQQSSDVPAVTQTCDITQSGAANYAYVNQNISQSVGSSQTGKQIATVTQGPASVTNFVQVSQAANQSAKTGDPQNQNADQSATVEQTATGSGTNTAALNQTQLQKEYARGTTQTQNTTSNLPDCNPTTTLTPGPTHPNACAVVLQTSSAGSNTNQLRQNVNEDQNSTGQANQTQGATDGGLDSRVHQGTDTGTSSNSAVLSKNQHQTAASGSSQIQHDPVSCCGFASQDGGTNNVENINLSSSQSASGDSSPEQTSDLIGTSHTPTGTCTVTTKASINQDSANSSDTESPCPFLTLETSCSTGEDGGCTASPPDLTNPAPPPDSSLIKGVRDVTRNPEGDYTPATYTFTGDSLQYQIVYSNSGTGDAHNVVVTDPIPSGVDPGSVTCDPDSPCTVDVDAGTITWNLGTRSPDNDYTMLFTATVNALCCETFTNTATGDDDEEAPFDSYLVSVTVTEIT